MSGLALAKRGHRRGIGPTGDRYEDSERFRWLGSMEGIPEPEEADASPRLATHAPWQETGYRAFEGVGSALPGVALACLLAFFASLAAGWIGTGLFGVERAPISPILIAITLGLAIRNSIGVPAVYEVGLALCLKRVLRVGVVLLGIRLGLGAVGAIGLLAIPIVATCIATALVGVAWVTRLLGLPRRLGTLIAVGTAICGNSAIVATGPVIRAKQDEVSYAVGCITAFGVAALLVYPVAAHWLFAGDPQVIGFFLGAAIHDTAQVAGAGMLYQQQFGHAQALDTAMVTKLVRNLCMIVVIPLMAIVYHRSEGEAAARPNASALVPLFVLGFIGMSLLRTLGDLGSEPFGGLLSADAWSRGIASVSALSGGCLAVAMASVGLGTDLGRLRGLGLKPLGVGLAAAIIVGAVGAILIRILSPVMAEMS